MPTYDYKCENCEESLEVFQRITEDPLIVCPKCGLSTLVRVVTGGAGVLYKGEGWYVTDYSKKSSGGKEQSESVTPAAAAPTPSVSEANATPSAPAKSTPTKSEPAAAASAKE